jgi:hypothetical protein
MALLKVYWPPANGKEKVLINAQQIAQLLKLGGRRHSVDFKLVGVLSRNREQVTYVS